MSSHLPKKVNNPTPVAVNLWHPCHSTVITESSTRFTITTRASFHLRLILPYYNKYPPKTLCLVLCFFKTLFWLHFCCCDKILDTHKQKKERLFRLTVCRGFRPASAGSKAGRFGSQTSQRERVHAEQEGVKQ